MVRRSFRFGLRVGLLLGIAFAILKVLQARRDEREQEAALRSTEPWPPITPAPPATAAAPTAPAAPATPTAPSAQIAPAAPGATWVDPEGRMCPQSHPIKGKLKSRLFHVPGMFAYDRTIPDRCYASEDAAEADGLTRARR